MSWSYKDQHLALKNRDDAWMCFLNFNQEGEKPLYLVCFQEFWTSIDDFFYTLNNFQNKTFYNFHKDPWNHCSTE